MNWKEKRNIALSEAFLLPTTASEMQRFLRDLMTEGEINEFARRFETASLLSSGASYPVVQKQTKFSPTTIARVSKWLQTGEGGYGLVLSRLHATHTNSHSSGRGLR